MNQFDLQQLVDRELKQLPLPKAPDALLSKVLAVTVQQAPSSSYGAWLAWPRVWQFASTAALVALATGAWMLLQMVHPEALLWRAAGAAPARVSGLVQNASDAATVGRVFWEVLLKPIATYVSALAISFALACALLWTAVERLALGGASER
jgi:hypothetical protein